MICAVMQPTYLPWLGYFDMIDASDVFVFYDDVQYVKGQWDSRNRIKTANGEVFLSVPIKKYALGTPYNEVIMDMSKPWIKKHLKTLYLTYKSAPYFDEVYAFCESELNKVYVSLADLNIRSIVAICGKLGISSQFMKGSDLESREGKKDERLVNICRELNCDTYVSPRGASIYIEEQNTGGEFTRNNINLIYQNYSHPEYEQNFGNFLPYMSIVDLLFYYGFEQSRTMIIKGRKSYFTSENVPSEEV